MSDVSIFTLRNHPELLTDYVSLVEVAFGYGPYEAHRFEQDFYPLLAEFNWENCYGLVSREGECTATIAAYDRSLIYKGEEVVVTILGAIAVAPKCRGQGYFKQLIHSVMELKRPQTDLFLLWSDKEEMFQKFGLQRAFEQTIYFKNESLANVGMDISEKKLCDLTDDEWAMVQAAFDQKYGKINHLSRSHQNYWKHMRAMSSVKCGLMKTRAQSSHFIGYYFVGKGKDLPGIVHEWAASDEILARNYILSRYEIWDYPFKNGASMSDSATGTSFLALARAETAAGRALLQENLFIGGVDSL